ncbi:lysophospholipid acyltransferase family protein [Sphingomonas prati]|uniref:1-acyl-sn-glycerol-3-phosphate acyltransferase n=1 Tax=Sphingomonas prati TaxID=1843237 RepID=A0A7W9BQB3_9SPHN|nr:lysophospholipid acyltransferase family protein [Sphingomonas prati]MBB5728211.1 1-acyl-sn-glycerol-3-phosphate acyltransferase [Sphingomonas prati]GGE75541.1 1-acyl-sn-glycerol-3-phosphate acyltransferase [Sphingomonas prati]
MTAGAPSTPDRLGVRLRIARRVAALVLFLLFCLVGYGLARPARRVAWVQRFLGGAARRLGADVTIAGTPLKSNVLYVANHLSWFDILTMGGATGTAFVSKEEVAAWPIVGWLARIGGTIFIARTSRAAARSQADALTAALATGRPATLFPEGETNDGTQILPFRAALFGAAPAAGVAVQPVAIDYGQAAAEIAWRPDETAPAVAARLIGRRGRLPVTLRFLDPVPSSPDRKQLAATAQADIEQALRP